MKKLADLVIVASVISVAVGIVSRWLCKPVYGIEASAFLQFAGVCLLLAIALILREK